jgi:hypothetical protein
MSRRFALLGSVLALLAAAIAMAAFTGCGDDDDDSNQAATTKTTTTTSAATYKTEVTKISTQFAQAGQAFKNSVSAQSTPQQAASALETFQGKVEKAADDLEGLAAPTNVAAPHRQLVDAFRGIAEACQPAIDSGKEGDRSKFRSDLRALQSALNGRLGNQAKEAAQQIDRGLAGQ